MDLLSSEDGKISKDFSHKGKGRKHIPVYASFTDNTFKINNVAIPRMIMGGFTTALKQVYNSLYEDDLEIIVCGKPDVNVFKFAERRILNDKEY